MTEPVATTSHEVRITSSERGVASTWECYGKSSFTFVLLLLGYELSFSHHFGDALTTAYELEGHFVQGPLSLIEFRHLVNHLLPFLLFQFLGGLGGAVSSVGLLHFWDLATAAASVMLLYRVLLEITDAPFISLAGTFAYATAHCVWIYTGTGRMYSTSMLLAFAAYYLALQGEKALAERERWVIAIAAAAMVCFACFFWLVHVFNAIGVGMLVLLLPEKQTRWRRVGCLALYSATGILLTLITAVSGLLYVQVPLTRAGVQSWMAASGTQPMKFGLHGLMAAAYGQGNGILAMPDLPYMIHGLMLRDPVLITLGSLPWQLGKFIAVWLLLAIVYLYPWVMFRWASRRQKILVFALYVPLAINMFFALGWLGTDLQRFLPTMLSQFGLGAVAVQDLGRRVPHPRLLGVCAVVAVIFISGVNLIESVLPSQQRYIILAAEAKAIRPYVHWGDLLVTFGRDLDNTYDTMSMFYANAQYFTLTNDSYTYNWDRPDWQAALGKLLQRAESEGGRLFVIDRLVLGFKPPQAAWSQNQHPHPTLKQFSQFLQTEYCVTPAFHFGASQYFRVELRTTGCPANPPALVPRAERFRRQRKWER